MSVKFATRLFAGWFTVIACVVVFLQFSARAQSPGRQFLHGHVPKAVARFHLQPIGRLSATKHLNLAIGLPLRNKEALDDLLQQIYDPASPNFRKYLTPDQFTEMFGPTEQDYQTVIAFVQANGLTITAMHPNRVVLDVSGSVADIERAFHVTMRVYQHPTENRTFYAPDVEPSVEAGISILDISGLNNYELPRPKNLQIASRNGLESATPKTGSGFGGAYMGNDFRAAYVPGVALNGSGQMVGLLEFDGYFANDITNYEYLAGIGNVPLQNVLLDGVSGHPGYSGINNAVAEVSLDIEMAVAMAPGLAEVVVFEGDIPNDVLNTIAASNVVKNLSSSWGWSGGPSATTDNIFKQMATQGQSFFNASGDSDAFTTGSSSRNGVDNTSLQNAPSSSPYITQVGGTTLSTTGAGGFWSAETTWNWDVEYGSSYDGVGSSGGISSYYSIPSWQQGIDMTANGGSTSMRNIPDVALTADNVFVVYSNGISDTFGGTSCAAPLWAGFTALVNQQAVANGQPTVGFINPIVYEIGRESSYTSDFHDITTGDNIWSRSLIQFYAVPGYDLCTGWGTPNGTNLINALVNPDPLSVSPVSGFVSSGPEGGPFNVVSQNFSLTNSGITPLNWSLAGIPAWLNASFNSGSLAVGGTATLTVGLNAAASNLLAGAYLSTVWFTNQASGIAHGRLLTLQLGQSVVQNGGFETGDFSFWTQSGNTTRTSVTSGNSQYVHSGTYGARLGPTGSMGYLFQTLPTLPGQNYLLSFWLDASQSGQFIVNWNTNAISTNTIFNQSYSSSFSWTNLQFIVTANGTNTVLQFEFQNNSGYSRGYFGLDDINVWPIPTPSFRSVAKVTNNALALTWNSLTSMVYQVQYSTNLARTNWTILSTNTANSLTLTVTNSIGTDPQRFYRIHQLP